MRNITTGNVWYWKQYTVPQVHQISSSKNCSKKSTYFVDQKFRPKTKLDELSPNELTKMLNVDPLAIFLRFFSQSS